MTEGIKTGGRALGTPNKATSDARKAIAIFVEKNALRLQDWLDRIAEENPVKAFELFQSVIEYHIPKLARTELTGPDGGPIQHAHTSDEEILKRYNNSVKDSQ